MTLVPTCGDITGVAALWACADVATQVVVLCFLLLWGGVLAAYAIMLALDLA